MTSLIDVLRRQRGARCFRCPWSTPWGSKNLQGLGGGQGSRAGDRAHLPLHLGFRRAARQCFGVMSWASSSMATVLIFDGSTRRPAARSGRQSSWPGTPTSRKNGRLRSSAERRPRRRAKLLHAHARKPPKPRWPACGRSCNDCGREAELDSVRFARLAVLSVTILARGPMCRATRLGARRAERRRMVEVMACGECCPRSINIFSFHQWPAHGPDITRAPSLLPRVAGSPH